MEDFFSRIVVQEWALVLVTGSILLLLSEIGLRCGLRLHAARDEAHKVQIGGIQGAVLSLLGLLLGFSMAMAVSRYDMRRVLVVKQANTIGTTYLRVSLLPEAHQGPMRDLLRRYLDVRLKYQPLADGRARIAEGERLSAALEAQLWEHVTAAAKEAPNAITGQFIATFNDIFNTYTERVAAARATIPSGVWLLLVFVAGVGCFVTTYNAGAQGARTILGGVLLPLLVTVVIVLIFDLAHPRQGLIHTSQQPLIDLQRSLQSTQP
jgi:hypothetical protein